MKKLLLTALLLTSFLAVGVQCTTANALESYGTEAAPRDITERNLKIKKSFSAVSVKQGVKLLYTVGNSGSVRIVGLENLVEKTVVTVEDGTLKVYLQTDPLGRTRNVNGLTVYVTAPAFNKLKMSSGGSVVMQSALSVDDDFSVKGSSGSIFKAEKGFKCATLDVDPSSGCIVDITSLKANVAHVNGSSGSIVTLKGSVKTLTAHISSGAIANLEDLKTQEGSVKVSSGAIANIRKGEDLSVVSSSGAIVNRR